METKEKIQDFYMEVAKTLMEEILVVLKNDVPDKGSYPTYSYYAYRKD